MNAIHPKSQVESAQLLVSWFRRILHDRDDHIHKIWQHWTSSEDLTDPCFVPSHSQEATRSSSTSEQLQQQMLRCVVWLYHLVRAVFRKSFRSWYFTSRLLESERDMLLPEAQMLGPSCPGNCVRRLAAVDAKLRRLELQRPRFSFTVSDITIHELRSAFQKYAAAGSTLSIAAFIEHTTRSVARRASSLSASSSASWPSETVSTARYDSHHRSPSVVSQGGDPLAIQLRHGSRFLPSTKKAPPRLLVQVPDSPPPEEWDLASSPVIIITDPSKTYEDLDALKEGAERGHSHKPDALESTHVMPEECPSPWYLPLSPVRDRSSNDATVEDIALDITAEMDSNISERRFSEGLSATASSSAFPNSGSDCSSVRSYALPPQARFALRRPTPYHSSLTPRTPSEASFGAPNSEKTSELLWEEEEEAPAGGGGRSSTVSNRRPTPYLPPLRSPPLPNRRRRATPFPSAIEHGSTLTSTDTGSGGMNSVAQLRVAVATRRPTPFHPPGTVGKSDPVDVPLPGVMLPATPSPRTTPTSSGWGYSPLSKSMSPPPSWGSGTALPSPTLSFDSVSPVEEVGRSGQKSLLKWVFRSSSGSSSSNNSEGGSPQVPSPVKKPGKVRLAPLTM